MNDQVHPVNTRARGEGGFTLMELLLVIAIMGIIVVPLSAALVIGLRTTDATANRVNSSHDAQLVSIYLPADLQSVGAAAGDVDVNGADSDCSGMSNVLRLRWTNANEVLNDPPQTHTYVAAYAVTQSSGEWQLVRFYCVDSGQSTQTVVAHNLNGAGAVVPTVNGSSVTLTITEAKVIRDSSNYQYTITGTRRTP